jgi:putative two-component system response regulator
MRSQSHQSVTGTILVADDQPSNRELLEEFLSAQGFDVISVGDGTAALQTLAIRPIDLVVLDVMMPKLTGFAVCEMIKTNPETQLIPVILVTALSDRENRLQGIKVGADDFLTRPVDSSELLARVRSLLKLKFRTDELERAESVLFSLARSIESKDPYTHGHCERLADYAVALGNKAGLSEDEIVALRRAGVVHDIGKVAVPDAILLKPGRLTEDEWAIVRQHPVVGERICAPLKSFRLVLPIIRHHHEKCDGSGYPDGLRRNAIPVGARILQIVDVFDALTTERPYKKALPPLEAFRVMRVEVRKGWWDATLFSDFERLLASQSAFAKGTTAAG